jgi:ferritin-like metal-binding protein YciE
MRTRFGISFATVVPVVALFSKLNHPGAIAMKMESLEDLYVAELKDLFSAENQLVKALPKMAKAATSKQLKQGFQHHLKQTKEHVARLKKVFAELDAAPGGKKCKAMEGLIKEGQEVIQEDAEPEVKDAALIAAAQRVEHYEIAGYGCVRTYAKILGRQKAADLLQQTLDEEAQTDETLSELAEDINLEADEADDEPSAAGKRNGRAKTVAGKLLHAVGMK